MCIYIYANSSYKCVCSMQVKPCVFFDTRFGCRDPGCPFRHVPLSTATGRPRKSKRDAYKRMVAEAFSIKARKALSASEGPLNGLF